MDRLKRRKKLDPLNEALRNFYGFQLVQNDNGFTVEYFENPRPPDNLKTIGFLNFHREHFLQKRGKALDGKYSISLLLTLPPLFSIIISNKNRIM